MNGIYDDFKINFKYIFLTQFYVERKMDYLFL